MERELTLDARCPACGAPNLVLRSLTERVPYFGESLFTTVLCERCDFRHATSMQLEVKPAARHTLRFRMPVDGDARVVRSHSGTYRIPELGFSAEPAEASEAFVTNLEGVLDRVRDILVRARLMFTEPAQRDKAEQLLGQLQRIWDGEEAATLVVEDPYGNSAILSDRTESRLLDAEEAALLRTGVVLLDAADLQGPPG